MSDHKFRDIFIDVHRNSRVGAMVLNADGSPLFINPVGCELFGCEGTPEYFSFFHSSIIPADQLEALKSGTPFSREIIVDFDSLKSAGLGTSKFGFQWLLCDIVPVGAAALSKEFPELYAAHFFDTSSQQLLKQKMTGLWRSAQAAFWEYDPFRNIYVVSEEFRQMVGLGETPVELPHQQMFGYVHPEDRHRIVSTVKYGIENQIAEQSMEARLLTEQGVELDVFIFSANVFNADGKLITRYGVTQDISRRKNVARKLLRSEKRYRDLFNCMENGFALHEIIQDDSGAPVNYRYLEANPAFGHHTGLDHRSIIGKTIKELAPGIEDYWIDIYGKVALTGESIEFENYSSELGKHYHVYAFCPEKGQFATIFSDITERKNMQQKLTKSEHTFRNLIHNIPDSTFLIDMEKLRFIHVNRAALNQYGYTEQEFYKLAPEQLSAGSNKLFSVVNQTGKNYFPRTTHKRKDGSTFYAEVNITWFELDTKPVAVATVHDLARQDELSAQLIQAQKMDALGRLAGGVAHDFNNLLQVIIGFGQMIQAADSDGQCAELAAEILQAGRSAKTLTDRMLAFSRKDFSVDMASIDIIKLLKDFKTVIRRAVSEDIEIHWILPQSLPLISGDATQIEQVIMNLCINAADAMTDGGNLTIEVREDCPISDTDGFAAGSDNYIRLSVTDDGIGMESDVEERIFEPFFTTKHAGGGTGLGLASSYAIIERHGGKITVDSTPGEGTRFDIWLATSEQSDDELTETAQPPTEQETKDFSLSGLKILLVEDDPMVRGFVSKALGRHQANITQACDGFEAEKIADRDGEIYDLIIMDVIMPGQSGVKVAEKLRQRGWSCPILFASGYSPERVGDIPGGDIINKPFGINELTEAIAVILSKDTTGKVL